MKNLKIQQHHDLKVTLLVGSIISFFLTALVMIIFSEISNILSIIPHRDLMTGISSCDANNECIYFKKDLVTDGYALGFLLTMSIILTISLLTIIIVSTAIGKKTNYWNNLIFKLGIFIPIFGLITANIYFVREMQEKNNINYNKKLLVGNILAIIFASIGFVIVVGLLVLAIFCNSIHYYYDPSPESREKWVDLYFTIPNGYSMFVDKPGSGALFIFAMLSFAFLSIIIIILASLSIKKKSDLLSKYIGILSIFVMPLVGLIPGIFLLVGSNYDIKTNGQSTPLKIKNTQTKEMEIKKMENQTTKIKPAPIYEPNKLLFIGALLAMIPAIGTLIWQLVGVILVPSAIVWVVIFSALAITNIVLTSIIIIKRCQVSKGFVIAAGVIAILSVITLNVLMLIINMVILSGGIIMLCAVPKIKKILPETEEIKATKVEAI